MLRHYDEIGILHPKCVDDFTGYRYYSEDQLPLAGKIQTLKNLGFGLSVIKEILDKYEDAQEMEQFLLGKRKELEKEAREIQTSVVGRYQDTEHDLSCEPWTDIGSGGTGYGSLLSGKKVQLK